MADVKITALGALTTVAKEDLLAIIDDPGVTPASRKITIEDVFDVVTLLTSKTPVVGDELAVSDSAASGVSKKISITALDTLLSATTKTLTNKTIDLTSNTLTATSAELATAISDETGSGLLVFGTSPTFVTPVLGTPASGVMTNVTGIVATSIADGTVTDAEFQYLGDVTSLIQAQVDLKSPLASPTFTGTVTTAAVDVAGNNVDNLQNLIHDTSTSGTDIDFLEDEVQSISIAANTTFTTVNRAVGKSKMLRITTDGTLRTLTFPTWDFIGTKPADQAASKVGVLSLTNYGTTDADIVAAYAVEA